MLNFPINYEGRIYRPPSEAQSLLLQVTVGCSNNKCTYCAMYRDKKYRERTLSQIIEDITKLKIYFTQIQQQPRRIFLCDGDALGASMDLLLPVLDEINETFPSLQRIGVYATAENILNKSQKELELLATKKMKIAYLGMESGDNKVLKLVTKGNSSEDMVEAGLKIKSAGFKLSIIAMLGLGGKKFSESHCKNTANAISKIKPEYFSFLTTTPIPNTPYARMTEKDSWQILSDKELLIEMKEIISSIESTDQPIIFRANHVSNLYPLAGIIPKDKDELLNHINTWINQCPENTYTKMNAESL